MKGPRLLVLRETGNVELNFLIYRIQYTDIAIARRPNFGASPPIFSSRLKLALPPA